MKSGKIAFIAVLMAAMMVVPAAALANDAAADPDPGQAIQHGPQTINVGSILDFDDEERMILKAMASIADVMDNMQEAMMNFALGTPDALDAEELTTKTYHNDDVLYLNKNYVIKEDAVLTFESGSAVVMWIGQSFSLSTSDFNQIVLEDGAQFIVIYDKYDANNPDKIDPNAQDNVVLYYTDELESDKFYNGTVTYTATRNYSNPNLAMSFSLDVSDGFTYQGREQDVVLSETVLNPGLKAAFTVNTSIGNSKVDGPVNGTLSFSVKQTQTEYEDGENNTRVVDFEQENDASFSTAYNIVPPSGDETGASISMTGLRLSIGSKNTDIPEVRMNVTADLTASVSDYEHMFDPQANVTFDVNATLHSDISVPNHEEKDPITGEKTSISGISLYTDITIQNNAFTLTMGANLGSVERLDEDVWVLVNGVAVSATYGGEMNVKTVVDSVKDKIDALNAPIIPAPPAGQTPTYSKKLDTFLSEYVAFAGTLEDDEMAGCGSKFLLSKLDSLANFNEVGLESTVVRANVSVGEIFVLTDDVLVSGENIYVKAEADTKSASVFEINADRLIVLMPEANIEVSAYQLNIKIATVDKKTEFAKITATGSAGLILGGIGYDVERLNFGVDLGYNSTTSKMAFKNATLSMGSLNYHHTSGVVFSILDASYSQDESGNNSLVADRMILSGDYVTNSARPYIMSLSMEFGNVSYALPDYDGIRSMIDNPLSLLAALYAFNVSTGSVDAEFTSLYGDVLTFKKSKVDGENDSVIATTEISVTNGQFWVSEVISDDFLWSLIDLDYSEGDTKDVTNKYVFSGNVIFGMTEDNCLPEVSIDQSGINLGYITISGIDVQPMVFRGAFEGDLYLSCTNAAGQYAYAATGGEGPQQIRYPSFATITTINFQNCAFGVHCDKDINVTYSLLAHPGYKLTDDMAKSGFDFADSSQSLTSRAINNIPTDAVTATAKPLTYRVLVDGQVQTSTTDVSDLLYGTEYTFNVAEGVTALFDANGKKIDVTAGAFTFKLVKGNGSDVVLTSVKSEEKTFDTEDATKNVFTEDAITITLPAPAAGGKSKVTMSNVRFEFGTAGTLDIVCKPTTYNGRAGFIIKAENGGVAAASDLFIPVSGAGCVLKHVDEYGRVTVLPSTTTVDPLTGQMYLKASVTDYSIFFVDDSNAIVPGGNGNGGSNDLLLYAGIGAAIVVIIAALGAFFYMRTRKA